MAATPVPSRHGGAVARRVHGSVAAVPAAVASRHQRAIHRTK
ncbi:hypothetical protein [Halostella salina]|nr:hypothetical protein [Halostella salina]